MQNVTHTRNDDEEFQQSSTLLDLEHKHCDQQATYAARYTMLPDQSLVSE